MSMTTDGFTVVTPPVSRREEARQDRLVQARIDRERQEARDAARLASAESAARLKRETAADREARRAARAMARQQARAERRAAMAAWAAGHVVDLLFVPIISVPAVLAWTSMAAYGTRVYGPAGRALPAFSEGAMWAFAAAVTITRHRDGKRRQDDPDADTTPVWHLRLGTIVFAAFGAALNFAHGYSAGVRHGAAAGVTEGVVMGLISVAGVTAHQIVTAGPRRTRAEKDAARIARRERKRLAKASRDAVDAAWVEIDGDGCARLVYEPTLIAPADTDTGTDTEPPEADTVADTGADMAADTGALEADTVADTGADMNADTGTDTEPASEADTATVTGADTKPREMATDTDAGADTATAAKWPRKRTAGADTAKPAGRTRQAGSATADAVTRLRKKDPDMPATVIAERLGISPRTVRRHLSAETDPPPETA